MKKIFNEGNQIHNFMSSSGSGTVIFYQVTVPVTVPVPLVQKLRFLRFRFRFHNTASMGWSFTRFLLVILRFGTILIVVQAHKLILSACSPYFRALLRKERGNCSECFLKHVRLSVLSVHKILVPYAGTLCKKSKNISGWTAVFF